MKKILMVGKEFNLQLFAEETTTENATTATETANMATNDTPTETTTVTIPALDNLNKLTKEDLLQLKNDFSDYPEAIEQAIAAKIEEEKVEAEKLVADVKKDIQETATTIVTVEQSFVQKYGQAIVHGVEIVLLAVIASKVLGWI